MNLLLATFWTLPHFGGLNSYVFQLKNQLEKLGHHVDLFARHPSQEAYYNPQRGIAISMNVVGEYVQRPLTRLFKESFTCIDPWILDMELERYSYELAACCLHLEQYDIIHVQDVVSAIAFSRIKPPTVRLIGTFHGRFTHEFNLSGIIQGQGSASWSYSEYLELLGVQSNDVTICPTNWLKTSLQGLGIDNNTVIIPYGIDISAFLNAIDPTMDPPSSQNIHVISCVARLFEYKGHKDLIWALKKLSERNDWSCWFIGEGPIRQELEQLVQKLGLERQVLFLGNRTDVATLLKYTDIFVLPTHLENLPYAVIEAQLANTPVIATDVGGIPEMVEHRRTGLLYPVGDINMLSENIKILMQDKGLRENLSMNAKQFALTKWPVENMVERTLDIYQRVYDSPREVSIQMKENPSSQADFPFIHPVDLMRELGVMEDDVLKKIISSLPSEYVIPDPFLLDKIKFLSKSSDNLSS